MEGKFIQRIVREAEELLSRDFAVYAKGSEGDLVTDADYLVERFLIEKIQAEYPDFAIISGVLGFETDDERVPQAVEIATKEGISIEFIERDEPSPVAHANTADLTLMSATRRVRLIGTSIGGGTVEVKYVEVDGFISNLSGPLPIIIEILSIEEDSTVEPLLEEFGISIGKQKELKEGSSRFISYELNGLISPTLQEKLQFIQEEKTIYVFT